MYKILFANITAASGLNFKEGEVVPAHKFDPTHIARLIELKAIEEYTEPVEEEVKTEPKEDKKEKANNK